MPGTCKIKLSIILVNLLLFLSCTFGCFSPLESSDELVRYRDLFLNCASITFQYQTGRKMAHLRALNFNFE